MLLNSKDIKNYFQLIYNNIKQIYTPLNLNNKDNLLLFLKWIKI